MIYEVLNIIRKEVDRYLNNLEIENVSENLVVLENIAKVDPGSADYNKVKDNVLLTLLSIEEESTLKNTPNYRIVNGQKIQKSTPAFLNLYIMFGANRTSYKDALLNMSAIVEFFQNKSFFTLGNTPGHDSGLEEFKFTIDLSTLKFEQLSYVWGVLGGSVMPSAFYKVSVIKVEKEMVKQKSPVVLEIGGEVNQK